MANPQGGAIRRFFSSPAATIQRVRINQQHDERMRYQMTLKELHRQFGKAARDIQRSREWY